MSIRLKRLYADYKRVSQLFEENPYITIKTTFGSPAERYQIEYNLKGLEQKGQGILEKNNHLVEIVLTRNYPTETPLCRMLTPIFHPNIDPYTICIGDHWTASESLADLIVRIGEMICYQSYNIKSPRNGEAARWADENIHRLPIDTVNLLLERRPDDIIVDKIEVGDLENRFKEGEKEKSQVQKKVDRECCSNCGAEGNNIQIKRCINGHQVCSDCIVECQKCRKALCVICSLIKCSFCGKIICSECQTVCPICNQIVCKEHLNKCSLCYREGCSQCIKASHSQDHVGVNEYICNECASKIKMPMRITYDDVQNKKVDEMLGIESIHKKQMPITSCKYCNSKIQNKGFRFCPTCGKNLIV